MADEQPAGAPAPAETGQEPTQQATGSEAGAGGQAPTEKPKGDEGQPNGGGGDQQPTGQDEEPPVRAKAKTTADYVAERRGKQLERARAALEEHGIELEDPDAANEQIVQVVDERLKPIIEKSERETEEAELSTFFNVNPDFKPYEAKIKKFAAHPTRRHLPIETIAYEVAGKDLMKIGASRERQAMAAAAASQAGGGNGPQADGAAHKPINEMTKEEFKDFKEKVRRGEVQWSTE